VSYRAGARAGPAAIISASHHVELFDEELQKECYAPGIATLAEVASDQASPESFHHQLFDAAKRLTADGKFILGLGGDHSISSALVRAALSRHERLSVLQVDAHCDLRDTYDGTRFSHACVMRRVIELGASVVAVGIRSVDLEEHAFMKSAGLEPLSARRCHESDDWIETAIRLLGETVYVTVDIDGFDPAYAPGTGTPEPGGLDWYQVTLLLRRVASEKRIVGADIVEVMPLPGQVMTEFLAAKLAYKIIAYVGTQDAA